MLLILVTTVPTTLIAVYTAARPWMLRGNRKLNHVIHMAAVSQIRNETPGRVYYDKKRGEGKTKKEALRALKRRVSDAIYKQLAADQI